MGGGRRYEPIITSMYDCHSNTSLPRFLVGLSTRLPREKINLQHPDLMAMVLYTHRSRYIESMLVTNEQNEQSIVGQDVFNNVAITVVFTDA